MSDTTEVKVPDIGDFEKVPVIEVLVSQGDTVEPEDSLITLESDKATMEVPSSHGGTVKEVKVAIDDEVSEGDVVVVLETEGAETEETEETADAAAESESEQQTEPEQSDTEQAETGKQPPQPAQADTKKQDQGEGHWDRQPTTPPVEFEPEDVMPGQVPHASPGTRKLARELGVELEQVTGTGRKGRITGEDLKQHVKQRLGEGGAPAQAGAGLALPPAPEIDFSKYGEVEEKPLSRINKKAGAHLHRNWVTIPHVTQHDEADISDLEAFRKEHDAMAKEQGTRLTLVVFLIKASVAALQQFPRFNSSLSSDGENLVYKKYFHIGIAVDTPDGLLVPVIRDCDQKGLLQLGTELTEISGRAREGKLKPEEMRGACFSISSLGGIGGTAFTPIVNAPEVAILGVSRASKKPIWDGEQFQPRLMLPLSLSYDHRVIDGAAAARFTRFLATRLEDFRRVLL